MVLGMQWLRKLRPILWDFDSLTMTFIRGDSSITLEGLNPSHSQMVDGVELSKLSKVERRWVLTRFQ